MQIIAGEFKNRRLIAPPGTAVRPTGERARQALFNILGERVNGARFLDLFAGTGAIGLEALSRGASRAIFVESDVKTEKVLQKNIARCGAAPRSAVYRLEIPRELSRIVEHDGPFGIVFADPPYSFPDYPSVVAAMTSPQLLAPNGVTVLEHRRGAVPPASNLANETRHYGENAFTFYYAL